MEEMWSQKSSRGGSDLGAFKGDDGVKDSLTILLSVTD